MHIFLRKSRKNSQFLKSDIREEGCPEEGVSSELAELSRRADQLVNQLRNLRYRLASQDLAGQIG
jgi:hypothetical protein